MTAKNNHKQSAQVADTDDELGALRRPEYGTTTCAACSCVFEKTGPNTKCCAECRPEAKRKYNRERARTLKAEIKVQQKAWRQANHTRRAEWMRRYYEENKVRYYDSNLRRRLANPEAAHRAQVAYYTANKDRIRASNRQRKYRVTTESLRLLFEAQGGLCAICGRTLTFETAHVDHDHATSEVRGLLCRLCNLGLGLAEPENLARYLTEVQLGQRGFSRPRPDLGGAPLTLSEKRVIATMLPEHCESCGAVPAPGTRGLHKDHCHRTGLVRGHLCVRCNVALASFGDGDERSLFLLRKAQEYLADPSARAILLAVKVGDDAAE